MSDMVINSYPNSCCRPILHEPFTEGADGYYVHSKDSLLRDISTQGLCKNCYDKEKYDWKHIWIDFRVTWYDSPEHLESLRKAS